jgi:glycosyltransferase involved in cell wall biosynthesis
MRILFVKNSLAWPRSSGHDVHTYYMMKACAELGHQVSIATVVKPEDAALNGLSHIPRFTLNGTNGHHAGPDVASVAGTKLQLRFRNYWGIPSERLHALQKAIQQFKADTVVVSGLDALPYFPGLTSVKRVWYAADEWVLHHLSQVRPGSHTISEDLRAAAVKGLYERAHRRVVDRVWVVSESDRRAVRWIAGVPNKRIDVFPNGVDGAFYSPGDEPRAENTAVFWGRLDFGPNIQALEWFCRRVWPFIRMEVPDARFTILGFHPTPRIQKLATRPGISLQADLPDIRSVARRHAVVVLPFVSGAGIKNKLLEAAALGLPIVCTPKTSLGLRGVPPLVSEASAVGFAAEVVKLWRDPVRQNQLSIDLRHWVLEQHTWTSVAREAVARLEKA